MVTGDEDFLTLDAEWRQAGKEHAGIVFIGPQIRHRGEDAFGIIMKELHFFHEAVVGGAATVENDFHNWVRRIT
jgi:hypothetical protein